MRIVVTADGSRTLTSSTFGETYGSVKGALSEARHVYLRTSGVESRLADGQPTRVLEVGFGTGLNFLVSAAAAIRFGTPLWYTALEREPLDGASLRAVHLGSTLPESLVTDLIAWVYALGTPPPDGPHRLALGPRGDVVLELVVGDALRAARLTDAEVHAVYLDAFSPKVNPEPWTPAFLSRLAASLAPGGTLVTFTVSGAVRRALAAAGLTVAKRPGPPGGKAEMLTATRPLSATSDAGAEDLAPGDRQQ